MTATAAKLERTTLRTSRLLDFCSRKELIAQTGHQPDVWPLVVIKELVDNALDACEEAGVAPEIDVCVDDVGITVTDNGAGMPTDTITDVMDFSVRISSREAYVAPDRGAQGNALKTILAMPFVLDGDSGRVVIRARGIRHEIVFRVDPIRQEPVIAHSGCKRYVLATDNDAPGRALREDLVRLLGPARCYFVEWPDGIKDANQFLLDHGPGDLAMFLEEDVREWPVTGLYGLLDIPEPAPLEIWRPGFIEWESKLAFAPRTVSAVTGHPGHGKTTLMAQLVYQICRDYEIKAAIASFETRAKPHHRRNIRQFMYGRLDRDLSDEERATADRWNHEHFRWIIHPNRRPTLRFVLDMAEVAVVRENARIVQIDPWNRLDSDRPDNMRETDWIGECLDELLDFARDLNVHVQVIAHPAKVDSRVRGQKPVLEDIAGSKHWDNKVDLGLCVHRPKVFEDGERKTEAYLYVLKSRFDECGYPCRLAIDYDLAEGRFKATDYRMPHEK